MEKGSAFSVILAIVIIIACTLLCMKDFPVRDYQEDGNLVLKTALGSPKLIPLDEIEPFDCPEGFTSHMVRTNGLAGFGRLYGHFKNTQTGQPIFMFRTGKQPQTSAFLYHDTVYIVDSWQ